MNLNALRTYALKDPATFPSSVLFSHSSSSLVIYDTYPKSIFHFLLLPRVKSPLDTDNLTSLRTLLKSDKERAKKVITSLAEDAATLRREIEGEMFKRYGFKWGIWTGFHAAPSMPYVECFVMCRFWITPRNADIYTYMSSHPTYAQTGWRAKNTITHSTQKLVSS